LGFEEYSAYNYNVSLNSATNKVAFTISNRNLTDDSKLLAVVIRGGGYGAEWASNFYIGANGQHHDGFSKASNDVLLEIQNYIDSKSIEGPFKIWLTGYSRGGAVANIVAARLNDLYNPNDIYAYTFGAPNSVMCDNEDVDEDVHNNIFNIVNPSDIVTVIPLSAWDFTRYGVNIMLPVEMNTLFLDPVSNVFKEITGLDCPAVQMRDTVKNAENVFLDIAPSTEDWYKSWQKAACDYIMLLNIKKFDSGIWESMNITESFIYIYGSENMSVLNDLIAITPLLGGVVLSSDILSHANVFLSLSRLHGLSARAVIRDLGKIIPTLNFLRTVSTLYMDSAEASDVRTAHSPEFYMAWMFGVDIEVL
jgi:hypothetical protein